MTEQRAFWSEGQLERRATDRRLGADRRQGQRRQKVFNPERQIWEYPQLEEGVLNEIRYRMQSAGAKVYRVRERIPKTTCARCKAPVWVGKHSDAGVPDLLGFFPTAAWVKLGGQASLWPVPWFTEVKREKGGVKRMAQVAVIDEINQAGALGNFANSWGTQCDYFRDRAGVLLPRS
jgi:hypothetical protein